MFVLYVNRPNLTQTTNCISGDSYSCNGFTTTGPQPSPADPLGILPPGATSSNGPNWVEYLTLVYNQSTILTYDLAFSGATVDDAIVASSTSSVISMAEQVNNIFLGHYSNKSVAANWTAEDSIFAFFIGINDIDASYALDESAALQSLIFAEYKQLLSKVYASGARNFLFLMVPPVNHAPMIAHLDSPLTLRLSARAIADWNRRLVDLAADLTQGSEAVAWVFDTNGLFNQILDGPRQFRQTAGLAVTDQFCPSYARGTSEFDTWSQGCQAPVNGYFWLNSLHPTYPVHDALASEIAKMLSKERSWPSVWELIAGGKYFWGR